MLYEGAIRFLRQAIRDLEAKDYTGKGRNIQRALDIIYELNTVLNMEAGGEISHNLRVLYNFATRHLTQANTQCDAQMIHEVITILEELNQGWRAATS